MAITSTFQFPTPHIMPMQAVTQTQAAVVFRLAGKGVQIFGGAIGHFRADSG